MGIYSFQDRFVPFILDGRKTHTIRAVRKYPDEPGDLLHLYNGLRTKKARLLMRAQCVKVENILLDFWLAGWPTHPRYRILIGDELLTVDEMEQLARRDGFESLATMIQFWREPMRLPFRGHIIHWKFESADAEP